MIRRNITDSWSGGAEKLMKTLKPYKIMHVRDSSGISGAERILLALTKYANRSEFDVSLLCLDRGDGGCAALVAQARKDGIPVRTVEVYGRWDSQAFVRIRRIFLEEQISLIHAHDFKSNFYALLASWGLGIRRVTTAHGSTRDSFLKKVYLCLDERVVHRWYDKVIAVSRELVTQLKQRGAKAAQLAFIENGLDYCALDVPEEGPDYSPLAIPEGYKVFSVVGRLFPDKGHHFFLEAFREVVRQYPKTMALLVGDGPSRKEIVEQVLALGLEKNVLLTGVRSDIKQIYQKSDVLVISSLREGLPCVLLEAMANSVPVVATHVGEIPSVIEDGVSGLLVSPGDVDALKGGMLFFLESPKAGKEMARVGLEVVRTRYSAENMTGKTEAIYRSLLDN